MQQHEEYHTATSVDSHALVAIASLSLGMVLYDYPRSALVASSWHIVDRSEILTGYIRVLVVGYKTRGFPS